MREHMGLHRGKRKDNGEWVEGWLVIKTDPVIEITYCFILAYGKGASFVTWYPVDPDTVGECTGLRDKNGKLIWEGDILRFYYEERELEADGFCVIHFGRFKDTDAISHFDHLGWYITITSLPNEATTVFELEEQGVAFEIIGNIYDNPELLKGGEGDG